ncbi:MAG: T9SS type A sorting domain-containing protein [Saprospiraceae bacterium]|nr:T9SS type A sorting domain-containing protein [Saprospiraceae bacterium]
MTTKMNTLYLFMFLCLLAGTRLTAQTAVCKAEVTKGTATSSCLSSINFDDIDDGSSDFDTYTLSQTEFTGPGSYPVTLTVTNTNGNSSSCESNVVVVDDVRPTPYVRSQVFVRLDMDNTKTLTPEMFDVGSFDNCSGISYMTVTPSVVTCNDISPVTVEVRVYDNAGNWDYAITSANLSNAQNSVQTLVCNSGIVVILGAGETKEIFTNEVLEGGPYKCWEEYDLDILENNVPRANNFVSSADVQKNIVARVKDITTNNTCWGTITVIGPDCAELNICDTKSRCDDEGDCNSGHTLSDDVEWPCDLVIVDVPFEIFNNPTPLALATFTGQDIDEMQPFLYNGDPLCNATVSKAYYDTYAPSGGGRLIQRTWTVIHWASTQSYSYVQEISMNSPVTNNCEICDTSAWNTPITDCIGGHSDTDAVEWPSDITVTSKRVSPVDLSYEPGINPNDVKPVLSENCASYFLISYTDVIFDFTPDSILVERTWSLLNTLNAVEYTYIQRIHIINPIQDGSVKVCVRQLNGNTLNNVELYPGNVIETGPCKEFDFDPTNTLVKPSKASTDYLSGVDLADLILLYEHILGIRVLEPSQVLSGDINGNNGVSTLDVVLLTKMINGETVNLAQWPSPWKFMYQDLYPSLSNIRNQVTLQSFNTPLYGHHFIGYKLGDINNSYFESNLQTIPVDVFDEIITAGEIYTVPVYSNDDINANGIQFKIHKNGKTEIREVQSSFFEKFEITEYETYYSIIGFNGKFEASNIKTEDLFLNITFKALQNSILSEALIMFDEGHNKFILAGSYAALPFKVTFEDIISGNQQIHLNDGIAVYPNPASDKLYVKGLTTDNQTEIWNMSGTLINQDKKQQNEMIDISQLLPGVYVLKVKTSEGIKQSVRFVKF